METNFADNLDFGIVEFDDFHALVKRIQEVIFYPDKIVLILVNHHEAVYTSVKILDMRIRTGNGCITPLCSISKNYYAGFKGNAEIDIEIDKAVPNMTIYFPNATEIIFFGSALDGQNCSKVFKKK